MSPFLRIGLSNFDCGSCQPCQGEAVNPYCAVLVKEYVESGELEWAFRGGGGGGGGPATHPGAAGSAPSVRCRKPTLGTRVPRPSPRGGRRKADQVTRLACHLEALRSRTHAWRERSGKEDAEPGLHTAREALTGTRTPRSQAERGPRWS